MKTIRVDAFSFEIARAIAKDLAHWKDGVSYCESRQYRPFAIILAMQKLGFVESKDYGREALFMFSAKAKISVYSISSSAGGFDVDDQLKLGRADDRSPSDEPF
jgi:hypothetical protein